MRGLLIALNLTEVRSLAAGTPSLDPSPKCLSSKVTAAIPGRQFFHPGVDRITPNHGPWWGETEVIIEGANFVAGLSAKIGGEWVTIKSVTPEKIVGLTRRYTAGTYDVLVRNPGMQENILFKAFKYE